MSKKFLSYEQQIQKLQTEKGLTISDISFAKEVLSQLSYYSLIGGYKRLFKHTSSNKYLYGVTLEEIVAFYYFDETLRTIFLKYILHVERNIKSKLSYYFCQKYGEAETEYLNFKNYTVTTKNQNEIAHLIQSLQKTISLPSRYTYITHHAKTYGNVPLWVTVNALTFGQTSKFYQYIPNDIQSKISTAFGGISERQLHQFISVIARCRNVCAHGERLYDFHIRETIPDMPLHNKLKIPCRNGQYTFGKQDLFSVVIALRYLIPNENFLTFKKSLSIAIKKCLNRCPHLSEERLLKEMGFPADWRRISRLKK